LQGGYIFLPFQGFHDLISVEKKFNKSFFDNFLPITRKYTDITELNTQILNELIQKIVDYEKTDNPNGEEC